MHSTSLWAVSGSVAAAILLHYLFNHWRRRKEPPGPWGLPLIGYLPWMNPRIRVTAAELREKYGDVLSIPMPFGGRFVMVQGYEAIREALLKSGDTFNGRVRTIRETVLNPYRRGIIPSQGADNENLRRFSLRTLKNFGVGRSESERVVTDEFELLKAKIVAHEGQAVNPCLWVNKAATVATCRFLYGDLCDYESPEFENYLKASQACLAYNLNINPLNLFLANLPFLRWFVSERVSNLKKASNGIARLISLNAEQLRRHKEQLNEKSEPGDYTDAFLQEEERRNSGKDHLFNDYHLRECLIQMFIGGSNLPTGTLNWGLLLMAVHSEVQEKVHSELASTIGLGRTPQMQDRTRTPYTDAVLHEVQRFCTIVPFTLPHSPMWDAKLRGFEIPKGAVMLFGLHSVHFDPKLWERPNEFYPEHFLDSTGTKFKASEHLIAYGLGRRSCMGEALAKMELYLFFSSLFLNFRVTLADKQPHKIEDVLRGNTQGGIVSPLDFNVHFQLR